MILVAFKVAFARFGGSDIGTRKPEIDVAELARHRDIALDRHMIEIVLGKPVQHVGKPRPRAPAAIGQRAWPIHRDTLAMKQPVQQPVRRQRIVEQFRLGDRGREDLRGPPRFLLRLLGQFRVDPARPGDPLDDQRRSPPPGRCLGTRQMNRTGQLLGGREIMQRHLRQRLALKADDPLMPLGIRPLIHGERQIPVAHQRPRARCFGKRRILGQPRIAAQRPRIGAIGQQHRHRPIALGLKRKRAAELQRGRKPRHQRQCLPQHGPQRHRMIMPGQQRIGQRSQPHQPAPNRLFRQEKRRHPARHRKVGHIGAGTVQKRRQRAHPP